MTTVTAVVTVSAVLHLYICIYYTYIYIYIYIHTVSLVYRAEHGLQLALLLLLAACCCAAAMIEKQRDVHVSSEAKVHQSETAREKEISVEGNLI